MVTQIVEYWKDNPDKDDVPYDQHNHPVKVSPVERLELHWLRPFIQALIRGVKLVDLLLRQRCSSRMSLANLTLEVDDLSLGIPEQVVKLPHFLVRPVKGARSMTVPH